MPEPVAFMVMPFNLKPTGRGEATVPSEIDFDLLWFRVYRPVLAELGYRPVRADADVGALIITEMIQRLVLGDLVVADLTLPNANVYYEVGVRHAASRVGCVLAAADWAQPVFDLGQMRQVRFPLPDGTVPHAAAEVAREHLASALGPLAAGVSPVFASVPGYPEASDPAQFHAFADLADDLMAFDADVRAAYLAPRHERRARAEAVLARHGHKHAVRQADALLLLRLLRDLLDWQAVLDYSADLPPDIAGHPLVREQRCLALAKIGDPAVAVAQLEDLMRRYGQTSERLGLLGGRYKQLYRRATSPAERRQYLGLAIDSYERGMQADLNDYYPASNLPLLYRRRGAEGDEARAADAEVVAMAACRRAMARGTADEWVRPTLLSLAFQRGDVAEARRLADAVAAEGVSTWRVRTTVQDLRDAVAGFDDDVARGLGEVLANLEVQLAEEVAEEPESAFVPPRVGTEPPGVLTAGRRPTVPLAHVFSLADVPGAVAPVAVPGGRPVLVLVGGAGGMDPAQEEAVRALLTDRIVPVVAETGAAVVDGGTDSGVMRAMGAAHRDVGGGFPLVGVVARGTVTLPGEPVRAAGTESLDLNHDLVVVAPGKTWGDESPWLEEVATVLASRRPSATLLVNGGPIALRDVTRSLERRRPVVVLAGTGRLADEVATAHAGSDEAVRQVAGSPLTRVVRLDDDAVLVEALRDLLTRG